MKRTTKKNPPATTPLRIMFSNYDEYESSSGVRGGINMFDDLLPGPSDQGRVFIGFPTHQTTGCAFQIAGHLIPTVERESIDFVDRTLSYWNQELLSMGGLLARVVFENDLDSVQRLYSELDVDDTSRTWLEKKAMHTLNAFTFKQSTPSPLVGRIVSDTFFKMSSIPIRIISTRGILPAQDVRMPAPEMKAFIKTTPTLAEEALTSCKELVQRLRASGYLKPIGLQDIFKELSNRTCTIDETVGLMKWWIEQVQLRNGSINTSHCAELQKLLVVQESGQQPISFARMTHFVSPRLVPADLPLPEMVLPLSVTRHFATKDLESCFWGLRELSVTDWTSFVIKHADFAVKPAFTEKVMATLSRHYTGSIPDTSRAMLVSILAPTCCIVTQFGTKMPKESYFPTVTLFDDLPKVGFEHPRSVAENFLKALGVREHVDLQMVFDRLNDLNWDQIQLIKYLASVQTKLTDVEINRLRMTPIFTKDSGIDHGAETGTHASPETQGKKAAVHTTPTQQRFLASKLYAPSETLRAFGLPLLAWVGKWKTHSDEARFMERLGLRTTVPVEELIAAIAAAPTHKSRMEWFKYFLDNHETVYKSTYSPSLVKSPFLPVAGSETTLSTPGDCFLDPSAAVMGFSVIHPDLKIHADKFGVQQAPSPRLLLDRLRTTPPTLDNAASVFTFLGSRQAGFLNSDWLALKNLKFIPVKRHDGVLYAAPSIVYFENADVSTLHSQFIYVDFGTSANAFLRACGVKDQPSPLELARSLVRAPQEFLDASGYDAYMELLRQIAANYPSMLRHNSTLMQQMKSSAFLIGIRPEQESGSAAAAPTGDQPSQSSGDSAVRFKLAVASEIYLVDDTVLSQIFRPLGAPIDELLEPMYQDLGSKWLSQHVQETHSPKGTPTATVSAQKLQGIINERAPLLLYDGHQMRHSRDLVSGAEQTLKALRVLEIPQIDIVRTFDRVSRTQRTTACTALSARNRELLLLITSDYDYFDVASAIGKIILKQPRLNDSLLLSTLLSTSLENLNRKGFPVDRILNLRASKLKASTANAVLEREQASSPGPSGGLQRSGSTLSQQSASAGSQSTLAAAGNRSQEPPATANSPETKELQSMFPDADPAFIQKQIGIMGPERLQDIANSMIESGYPKGSSKTSGASPPSSSPQQPKPTDKASSDDLFGMLNKFTGLDIKKNLGGNINDLTNRLTQSISTVTGGAIGGSVPTGPAPSTNITPRQTDQLKSHLAQSITTARGARESSIRSQIPNDPPAPPPLQQVANQCNVLADQDLVLLAQIDTNMPFYVDRHVLEEGRLILVNDRHAIDRFATVLRFLSRVFALPRESVHIYWDKDGSTIAFNRGRSLFFNLRYYLGLHYPRDTKPSKSAASAALPGGFPSSSGALNASVGGLQLSDERAATFYYWFMTFCHELAHNFVSSHDSLHEYWMSSFAETYMGQLVVAMHMEHIDLASG
ncbi:hypothetical protein BC831DRAFT_428325 [Entophlyctis helioformis]|nr:hypothetical protein BC831DRAFT_428325 [Entophlyctis helioformis]